MLAKHLYYGILAESLSLMNLRTYMEIGSYDGEGIALLSNAFPDKMFYSIDPFIEDGNTINSSGGKKGDSLDEIRDLFVKNTRNFKNIIHYDMTSEEFIKRKLYKDLLIDILFIDGDHSVEGTSIDLTLAVLLSKNKHLFVVMDDLYLEGVASALDRFRIDHPEVEIKSNYDTVNKVFTTAYLCLP